MTSSANEVKIEISNKKTGQVTRFTVLNGNERGICSSGMQRAFIRSWTLGMSKRSGDNVERWLFMSDEQHITREFDNDVNDIENLDKYLMSSDSESLPCSELFKNIDQLMDMGVNENEKIKTTSQPQIYIEHSSLI